MNTFYKILVVVLLLSILGVNVISLFSNIAKESVDTVEETAENIVKNTEQGVGDLLSVTKRNPSPDESDKSIFQQRNKKRFCYVGSDRGNRSCIEMNDDDICVSKQTYHHYKKCINPRLRL